MVEGKVWRNMDDLLNWANALSILPSKTGKPAGAIAIAALRDVNSPAPARESSGGSRSPDAGRIMQSRNVCPVFDTGTDVITGRKQKFRRCVQKSTSPLDCLHASIRASIGACLPSPAATLRRQRTQTTVDTRSENYPWGNAIVRVRGLLVYCADSKCAHAVRITANRSPAHIRLDDLEPLFTCQACGRRGADLRPDFDWDGSRSAAARSCTGPPKSPSPFPTPVTACLKKNLGLNAGLTASRHDLRDRCR